MHGDTSGRGLSAADDSADRRDQTKNDEHGHANQKQRPEDITEHMPHAVMVVPEWSGDHEQDHTRNERDDEYPAADLHVRFLSPRCIYQMHHLTTRGAAQTRETFTGLSLRLSGVIRARWGLAACLLRITAPGESGGWFDGRPP